MSFNKEDFMELPTQDDVTTKPEISSFINNNENDILDLNKFDIEKDEHVEQNLIKEQTQSFPSSSIEHKIKLGNTYAFFYDEDGRPKIIIGPNWPFFVGLTLFVFLVVSNYLYFLWNGLNKNIRMAIIILYIANFISYTYTALFNPGIKIYNSHSSQSEDMKVCGKCYVVSMKSEKVEHCSTCNLCILERDHHCPWVTKCVGKDNLYPFYAFVFTVFTLMLSLYIGAFTYIFK